MTLPRLSKSFLTAVAATAILTTAACGADSEDSVEEPTASAPADSGDAAEPDASGEGSGDYTDGTYEASGSYNNPGGTSTVSVEMTIEDGAVAAVEVTPEARGTSGQFQNQFAGGIADQVVGQPVDELEVGKVAGSSLTAGGFNAALDDIRADASA